MIRLILLLPCLLALAAGALAQTPAPTGLPAGHPTLDDLPAAGDQPVVKGTLTVRVAQGTAGGPVLGAEPVTVELYHRGKLLQKLDSSTDSGGAAVLRDLPAGLGIQPVVTVTHAGVPYQITGEPMDAQHPDQQLDVKVYETTEQAPAWRIGMRHVMVMPAPGTSGGAGSAAYVREMLMVIHPGDRTWLGAPDGQGRRTTLVLPLPPGATDVQLGEGLAEGSRVGDGLIVLGTPVNPGTTRLEYAYLIPAPDQQATITFAAPAATKKMVVLSPEDGSKVTAQGLEAGDTMAMGKGKMRVHQATDLQPGQQTVYTITGLMAMKAPADEETSHDETAAAPAGKSSDLPKIIAALGGVLLLGAGVVVMVVKGPKKAVKQ